MYPWSGDTDMFSFGASGEVRLNAPSESGGTACIYFPYNAFYRTYWTLDVHLAFNPSANNYARFYMAASSPSLSSAADACYVQIGGEEDNVSLWQVEDGTPVCLIEGRTLMQGDNSPELSLKVECDADGRWTLWTRGAGEDYTYEGDAPGTGWGGTLYAGLYCVYTKSRSRGFTFRNLQVVHEGTEGLPPEKDDEDEGKGSITVPAVPDLPDDVRGMLLFTEVMYNPASGDAEYVEIYNPTSQDILLPSLLLYKMYASGEVYSTTVLRHSDADSLLRFPSRGYLCFTGSVSDVCLYHAVDAQHLVEVASFPRLNNDGGYLAIVTTETEPRTIDTCSFLPGMHDVSGKTKGIALEKKSPELPSRINANWHSSRHASGGTPGEPNG